MSLFYEVLYWLIKNCLYLVDCIMEVFGVLSGLTSIEIESGGAKEVTLLEYLITNRNVQTVFLVIATISVFIAAIFMLVSIIKNSVVTKHKSHYKTLFEFLMTTTSTFLTVFGLLLAIWLANEILILIDMAFNGGADYTLGQTIMNICAGQPIDWGDRKVNGFAFAGSNSFFGDLGDPSWGIFYDIDKPGEGGVADITTFNFLTATVASVALFVVMIQTVLGLTTRIFNIIFLYLSSPLIIATVPLDDGARFKLWRETAISKVLLAYGSVLAVNIFILALPLIQKINIQDAPDIVNDLFILILVVCGAFTIPTAQLLFSRLIGTQAEENREATSGLRSLFGTALGTGRMIAGAKRAVFGGVNRYGRPTKGMLHYGAKAGGGAANVVGGVLGGNAYRGGVTKMKSSMANLKNTLKGNFGKISAPENTSGAGGGKFMQGGGLIGMAKKVGNPTKSVADTIRGSKGE